MAEPRRAVAGRNADRPSRAGVDYRLRIYDLEEQASVADTQLALGPVYGDWTPDGRQFFAWNYLSSAPGAPARLSRWPTGSPTITTVDLASHGVAGVGSFVALSAQANSGLFAATRETSLDRTSFATSE